MIGSWNDRVAAELASYGFTPEEVDYWMALPRARGQARSSDAGRRASGGPSRPASDERADRLVADIRSRHGLSWREASRVLFPELD